MAFATAPFQQRRGAWRHGGGERFDLRTLAPGNSYSQARSAIAGDIARRRRQLGETRQKIQMGHMGEQERRKTVRLPRKTLELRIIEP